MVWECSAKSNFDGDVLVTDPYYMVGVIPYDTLCECIRTQGGLVSTTYYGDWGCTLFKTKGEVGAITDTGNANVVGKFCADLALVCAIDLKVALEINPSFLNWLDNHKWCGVIVKGFKGTVRFMTLRYGKYPDEVELRIRFDGEVEGQKMSLESMQTSI